MAGVAYDALHESVRLLQGEPPPDSVGLSRRRRHAALAVDRDGDVAATLFLRRGVSGEPWLDAHTLESTRDGWRVLGGGGSNAGENALDPRPSLEELEGPTRCFGGGATARNADRRMPWGAKWVSYAELRVATEVSHLRVDDRVLPVAEHGVAIVVWALRPPQTVAQDRTGRSLGTARLSPGLPRSLGYGN